MSSKGTRNEAFRREERRQCVTSPLRPLPKENRDRRRHEQKVQKTEKQDRFVVPGKTSSAMKNPKRRGGRGKKYFAGRLQFWEGCSQNIYRPTSPETLKGRRSSKPIEPKKMARVQG